MYTSVTSIKGTPFPFKVIVLSLIAGFPLSESVLFSGIYSDIAIPPHNDSNSLCELLMLLRRGDVIYSSESYSLHYLQPMSIYSTKYIYILSLSIPPVAVYMLQI